MAVNNNQNDTTTQMSGNENVQTPEIPGVNEQDEPQAPATPVVEQPKESELFKKNAELEIELKKQKKMIDDYSSQISKLKKQLNEKIANEGVKVSQQTEELEAMKEKLEKAERDIAFRKTVDDYLALGMDKDYAVKVATAKMENEEESVNALLKGFINSERRRVKEETTTELYKNMPEPISGNGDGQIDYEKQYNDKLAAGDTFGAITAQLLAAQQQAAQ